MGDSPAIPAELPDDYKELQALAAEHDIKAVGVKKADLVKALEAKRTELASDAPTPPAETAPAEESGGPETATDATDEPAPPAPPAATAEAGESVEIEHQTTSAWWCPVCDHSHTHQIGTCQKCGAVRDGDTVTVVA